jgi:hypothetical protein
MNKTYEAPVAEMIEMQMPTVLMSSGGGGGATGNTPSDPSTGGWPNP